MLGEVANAPMREAIARLEAQYEADKRYALENQRREYEKQFQHLRSFLSPATTPMAGPLAAFGMAQDQLLGAGDGRRHQLWGDVADSAT